MNVLGFDCAGRGCSAAVLRGDTVLASRAEPMERGQAEKLMPLIVETLAAAGVAATALDLVAVTTGPGGFTGVRIGLAAARGLALGLGRPLIGISSFAAVAAAVPLNSRNGRKLVVALDSKRDEFYLQGFGADGAALGDGALVPPAALAAFLPPGKLLLAGDAAARLAALLAGSDVEIAAAQLPDPADVARLGAFLWHQGERAPPRPLYLRAPDTTAPRSTAPGAVSATP
ncbi:MAG TPA: tRNA (adenosine(37)-N6)-threonylcarbamoyltransferase complex dimerization subunit type 1 TsaB [Stellaceae bacterium]|nr:tRNA (adenosine(37)-N6)-threonylcarbamoyltransferase complex dimerization subunit type 1 TsaB [Stellaceae bacterium]